MDKILVMQSYLWKVRNCLWIKQADGRDCFDLALQMFIIKKNSCQIYIIISPL